MFKLFNRRYLEGDHIDHLISIGWGLLNYYSSNVLLEVPRLDKIFDDLLQVKEALSSVPHILMECVVLCAVSGVLCTWIHLLRILHAIFLLHSRDRALLHHIQRSEFLFFFKFLVVFLPTGKSRIIFVCTLINGDFFFTPLLYLLGTFLYKGHLLGNTEHFFDYV